jgi:type VI secretion system protein ImpH
MNALGTKSHTQDFFPANAVMEDLISQPWAFDFFQAVRLIENNQLRSTITQINGAAANRRQYKPSISFAVNPSPIFAAAELNKIDEDVDQVDENLSWRVWVNFMGLVGASGTLPPSYTEMMLQYLRNKDTALQEFLRIFEHRGIQLFYRAWKKYFFPVNFEQAALTHDSSDVEKLLLSLVGDTPSQRHQQVPDHLTLFYGGHFYAKSRSAAALQQILSDYFQVGIKVVQFQGEWIGLEQGARSRLGAGALGSANNCLGISLLAGAHVWQCQHKFRVIVGPLSQQELSNFLPGSPNKTFIKLCNIIRRFVDAHLIFDVQLRLKRDEVPVLTLNTKNPRQLGFNSWLFKNKFTDDVSDVVVNEKLCYIPALMNLA